jgi:hypothetical protein
MVLSTRGALSNEKTCTPFEVVIVFCQYILVYMLTCTVYVRIITIDVQDIQGWKQKLCQPYHCQVQAIYIFCQALPCPVSGTFAVSWFCVTSAVYLTALLYIHKCLVHSRTVYVSESLQWHGESCFPGAAVSLDEYLLRNSWVGRCK